LTPFGCRVLIIRLTSVNSVTSHEQRKKFAITCYANPARFGNSGLLVLEVRGTVRVHSRLLGDPLGISLPSFVWPCSSLGEELHKSSRAMTRMASQQPFKFVTCVEGTSRLSTMVHPLGPCRREGTETAASFSRAEPRGYWYFESK
jgi:hypothetical protein